MTLNLTGKSIHASWGKWGESLAGEEKSSKQMLTFARFDTYSSSRSSFNARFKAFSWKCFFLSLTFLCSPFQRTNATGESICLYFAGNKMELPPLFPWELIREGREAWDHGCVLGDQRYGNRESSTEHRPGSPEKGCTSEEAHSDLVFDTLVLYDIP